MFIVNLQGGLGNQMFQYAFGKSIHLKYDKPVYFDISSYNHDINKKYELHKFGLELERNRSLIDLSKTVSIVYDDISDFFDYDRFLMDYTNKKDNNLYFDGYWQSEKYFIEFKDIILKDFEMSFNMKTNLKVKYPQLDDSICVSMHIRRTDYLTLSNYHPVQTIEYYEKALETIGKYDYIFVFSDDIEWCKDNLKFDNMIFVEGNDNLVDMRVMSLCTHNVIANSSFSWWGAYLNMNIDKIVIIPKNWFGPASIVTAVDINADKWKLI